MNFGKTTAFGPKNRLVRGNESPYWPRAWRPRRTASRRLPLPRRKSEFVSKLPRLILPSRNTNNRPGPCKRETAAELWAAGWGDEDLRLRKKLAASIAAMFEAAEEYRRFKYEARTAGALTPEEATYAALFVNCATCATLPALLRTCRAKEFARDNAHLLR